LSSFTHRHLVPRLYEFLSYAEVKKMYFVGNQTIDDSHWLTKYFILLWKSMDDISFRVERNSYRFGI